MDAKERPAGVLQYRTKTAIGTSRSATKSFYSGIKRRLKGPIKQGYALRQVGRCRGLVVIGTWKFMSANDEGYQVSCKVLKLHD